MTTTPTMSASSPKTIGHYMGLRERADRHLSYATRDYLRALDRGNPTVAAWYLARMRFLAARSERYDRLVSAACQRLVSAGAARQSER